MPNRLIYLISYSLAKLNPPGKIVIIGCGRSGTNYISEVFKSLNLVIGHEYFGKDGISSWRVVPDTDIRFGGPSFHNLKKYKKTVLHQVRHPLKTIGSLLTFSEKSWLFTARFIRFEDSDSLLLKSMKCWYYWNLMAEKKAVFTYRVEAIESVAKDILRKTGYIYLFYKYNVPAKVKSISKSVNQRNHKEITIEMLKEENAELAFKIVELAEKYGYEGL